MDGETAGIENTITIGHRHIAEQEDRIARQESLVEKLVRDGHERLAIEARKLLSDMHMLLSQMQSDLSGAEQRLRERTGRVKDDTDDQTMMDKVTRDCPL